MGEGLSSDQEERVGGGRRPLRGLLPFLGVLLAGLVLGNPPALALSQRGHVFLESFAKEGTHPGELSSIAVNETTGDVYVADRSANEVEQFQPTSEGTKYSFLKALTEIVTPEYVAVDNARKPQPPESEPEDPSKGDVYVSSTAVFHEKASGTIYKFNASGEKLAKITKVKERGGEPKSLGRIVGLAVGPKGTLWLDGVIEEAHVLARISDAEAKAGVALLLSPLVEVEGKVGSLAPGFALDSAEETLYIGQTPESEEEAKEAEVAVCVRTPCTVAKLGRTFVEGEENVEPLVPELVSANTSAVAVDLFGEGAGRDDVYLDNLTSVTALSSTGSLVQHFGSEEGEPGEPSFAGLKEGRGIAIDSSNGNVFVVDAGAGSVDLFRLKPPGKPTVDSVSASKVESTSARLVAQIDPADGEEPKYYFQYATTTPIDCPRGSSSCEVPVGGEDLERKFGDQEVAKQVTGLSPGMTYHYDVTVETKLGTFTSKELTFTTQATSGQLVLPDGRGWELVSPPKKQGASVDPIPEEGGAIQAAANGDALAYLTDGPIEEVPEGNRNPEVTQVLATRGSTEWASKEIATPDESSHGPSNDLPNEYRLFSPDLSLALVYPFVGNSHVTPFSEPALSPLLEGEAQQEKTPYIRVDGHGTQLAPEAANEQLYKQAVANGKAMSDEEGVGYLPLVTTANAMRGFGGKLVVEGATPELNHVVLSSKVPLLSSQPSAPPESLYEWNEGQLTLVSELPNKTLSTEPSLAEFEGFDTRNAISEDGSRVFWGQGPKTSVDLYMRDTVKGSTIQLDVVQGEHAGENAPHATFQIASPDGSSVLFTDPQRLTESSGHVGNDLYECKITEVAGQDTCDLTDVTPETESGESADVLGTVISNRRASVDYFVANGVLSSSANPRGETAQPGHCVPVATTPIIPPLGATCNLYMLAPSHQITFVARLSNEDAHDWEGRREDLGEVTSRVSENGEYLAFMSERSLTGYDNADANSGEPDEEVFLYDTGAETSAGASLICASCNPSGARPEGIFDVSGVGAGEGPLVDRPQIWSTARVGVDHWLAGSVPGWIPVDGESALYQDRYLSNSGRLFFDSSDALVPQDTNEKEDVYEYEPANVGKCTSSSTTFSPASGGCDGLISSGSSNEESAFLDASETGADVFFLTAASLTSQGAEAGFNVYDAHECSPESPCLTPTSSSSKGCNSEESCRPGASAPPVFGAPASTTFSGAGNVVPTQQALPFKKQVKPLTKAQLLAKALKACRKDKKKDKRLACEKQARKKYGAKLAKKAGSAAKHQARGSSR